MGTTLLVGVVVVCAGALLHHHAARLARRVEMYYGTATAGLAITMAAVLLLFALKRYASGGRPASASIFATLAVSWTLLVSVNYKLVRDILVLLMPASEEYVDDQAFMRVASGVTLLVYIIVCFLLVYSRGPIASPRGQRVFEGVLTTLALLMVSGGAVLAVGARAPAIIVAHFMVRGGVWLAARTASGDDDGDDGGGGDRVEVEAEAEAEAEAESDMRSVGTTDSDASGEGHAVFAASDGGSGDEGIAGRVRRRQPPPRAQWVRNRVRGAAFKEQTRGATDAGMRQLAGQLRVRGAADNVLHAAPGAVVAFQRRWGKPWWW